MRHDDLTLVAERQVPAAGQLAEARGDLRGLGAELGGQRTGSGARPVSANARYTASRRSSPSMPLSSQSPMNTEAGRRLSG